MKKGKRKSIESMLLQYTYTYRGIAIDARESVWERARQREGGQRDMRQRGVERERESKGREGGREKSERVNVEKFTILEGCVMCTYSISLLSKREI